MTESPISVLIVDDSALMRNLVSRIFESAPGFHVAGTAMNGVFALKKLEQIRPDVIVLDLEMPEMNGIEFLQQRRKRGIDIPVIILSSIAEKGARITMEALALGASDFVLKPGGALTGHDMKEAAEELIELVGSYGRRGRRGARPPRMPGQAGQEAGGGVGAGGRPVARPAAGGPGTAEGIAGGSTGMAAHAAAAALEAARTAKRPVPVREPGPIEVIAIGISTGGPNALRELLSNLDADLPAPVLIVQHMPAGFTEEFAQSLGRVCPLEVREAKDGDIIVRGRVFVAPGASHMTVDARPLAKAVRLSDEPPVNGHRPSCDVLFASVAKVYANRCLGIIMTGMGRDGAANIGAIYREGGITIAQDESSSVVFGMPRVAIESGVIHHVVPLSAMAETVNRLSREHPPL